MDIGDLDCYDPLVDEDSPYLLPTVCVNNSVTPGQHITDPTPGNNGALSCQTILLERLFTPSFSAVIDEGAGPDNPATPPLDDSCLTAAPCEMLISYTIPGGQPLAGVLTFLQGNGTCTGNFYITRGIADPCGNGTTPNGVDVLQSTFSVNLKIGPGTSPCNVPAGPVTFTLFDGAIPASQGEGPNDATQPALVNPAVWPTRVESSPLFLAFDPNGTATAGGAPVWARYTALIPALNSPANVIVFNLGAGGWAQVLITGDPTLPASGSAPQPCTPLIVNSTFYGETDASDSLPGRDLRVCTVGFPSYLITGQFQRTDTGQSVIIPDPNQCVGDNDVSITKSDNLVANPPADITTTDTISITVTNGQVPGNVAVSVSLMGPAICSPTLVAQAGDGNTTPDVLTGPTTVGGQTTTRLDFTELAMTSGEVRNITRNYTVNCPLGGPYTFQIVVNASSAFNDPDLSNNQDENHPVKNVTDNDLDDDGVVNSADNCPSVPNPGQ
jgi:hypothetical protein